MVSSSTFIRKVITKLNYYGIFSSLYYSQPFHDEPIIHYFRATINLHPLRKIFPHWRIEKNLITHGGISFHSRSLALLRCIGECLERISLYVYDPKRIIFSTYNKINNHALNPQFFNDHPKIVTSNFGWVQGYNLIDHKPTLIPAQLIYLNYPSYQDKFNLHSFISTGAAGGFNRDEAILRGIYEVIERDAFMTSYLIKANPKSINLSTIKNKRIQALIKKYQDYRFKVYLFDISNDLEIPTFLSILFDKNKNSTILNFGAKTNYDPLSAILGSLEEAYITRHWIRELSMKEKKLKKNKTPINIRDRALYWLDPKNQQSLSWLFSLPVQPLLLHRQNKFTTKQQLDKIVNLIKNKNYSIYYVDLKNELIKEFDYHCYKVIIPQLQPLYLNETHKIIKIDRLKVVARYFRQKLVINKIPQPFL